MFNYIMKIKACSLIENFSCTEDESVIDAAKKLSEVSLRHIFVLDKKGYPSGIISITDINNRIVAQGKNPNDLTAKDIMSQPIEVYDLEDDVEYVCKKMISKKRVMDPVVKKNKMIGIITLHQLLKNLKNE